MTTQESREGWGLPSKVELLVFLLDGSGSMCDEADGGRDTFDKRTKGEHLLELVRASLDRLAKSSKAQLFRISFIYFAGEATVAKTQGHKNWFELNTALELIKNPCPAQGYGTSIANAFEAAYKLLDEFNEDRDRELPQKKKVTTFLFTDGQEVIIGTEPAEAKERCITKALDLKAHNLAPILATISLGDNADLELLKEIASEANDGQIEQLDIAGVISSMEWEENKPKKLFLRGTVENKLTNDMAEAIRNFVDTLSDPAKEGSG